MRVDLGGPAPAPALQRQPPGERPPRSFGQLLQAPALRSPEAEVPGQPLPSLAAALARAADADRAVDGLLAAAARGRTFTPAQLLALQATVSRGAQAVEVLSRATDRLVGTIKQAMGTQV